MKFEMLLACSFECFFTLRPRLRLHTLALWQGSCIFLVEFSYMFYLPVQFINCIHLFLQSIAAVCVYQILQLSVALYEIRQCVDERSC